MNITIRKINSRQYLLNNNIYNRDIKTDYDKIRLMDESKNIFFESNTINTIRNFQNLDEDSNMAFLKALDAFDLLLEHGSSESVIKTQCDFLVENVSKVRDPDQLKRSLKYRFGRLKRSKEKMNKIDKANDKINNTVKGAINNLSKKKPNIPPTVKEEYYEKIYNETCAIYECDRIVNNYSTIHNRYNIDNVITSLIEGNIDLYESIYKITSYVDTFNIPFKNRYNSALETVWYGLNKRYVQCENSYIVNTVTDYYIFNGGLSESDIDDIHSISKTSPIYNEEDFDILSYLDSEVVDNTINDNDFNFYGADYDTLSMMKDLEESKMDVIVGINTDKSSDVVYNEKINKLINDFKKSCMSNKDNAFNLISLKALVEKLCNDYPEQIIFNLRSLLPMIRMGFIESDNITNKSDVFKLITLLIDSVLESPIDKGKIDNLINIVSNEIDLINNKIEKYKDDEYNEIFSSYKDELNKLLTTVKDFSDTNFNSVEDDSKYEFDDDNIPEDISDDSGLVEAATIVLISELCESIIEDTVDGNVDKLIYGNVRKFSDDTLDTITQFAMVDPYVINRDKLKLELEKYKKSLRESHNINDYMRLDIVNENINRLSNSVKLYNTYNDPKGIIAYLMCLNEIKYMNPESDNIYFSESVSFINTLKIAVNNLKRKATNLNEKQKQASNTLDSTINNLMRSMEKNMDAENREAIARGQVLPSASKCIKLALTFGIAWLVNPVIAVIGAVGAYFTKKSRTQKERQLALDEIEVELKMCERYMRIYEDKNDLEAVRQCEIIQRNLQRQYQRIKYKMKVDFKHADTSSAAIRTSTGNEYK